MRKLIMAGVLAAVALVAPNAGADDAAKERREAADATKAEVKQDAREARSEVKQEGREARQEMKEAGREMKHEGQHAREGMHRDATARGEKKHPMFEGKNNFDMKGKVLKVSANSITIARDDLPAATLVVSPNTKIELDGERASIKQLLPGQDVKASFNLQGQRAEAVEIKAEKKDK